MKTQEYASERTTTGLPVPSRVTLDGVEGTLWGIGYSPKGEICMVDFDDGRSYVECKSEELKGVDQ